MNRGETLNQIRRILLLSASRRQPRKEQDQLELPLGRIETDRPIPGSEELDEIGQLLHSLTIEILMLVDMECSGLVESPLLERRRRLRLGSTPPLRLLQEWGSPHAHAAVDAGRVGQSAMFPAGSSPAVATLDRSDPAFPAVGESREISGPSASRDNAYQESLIRARGIAIELELGRPEIEELAKRLYQVVLTSVPEDDLCGLVHSHGLRHRLVRSPRGKLSFKVDRDRSRGSGGFSTPSELIQELTRAIIDPAFESGGVGPDELQILDPTCGSGQFLLAAANRLTKEDDRPDPANLLRVKQVHGVDLDPRAARIAAHNLSIWTANLVQETTAGAEKTSGSTGGKRPRRFVGDELDATLGSEFPYFFGKQIQVGNALLTEASSFAPGFIWEKRFPEVFEREPGGFDIVIGNPPWISFGLRDRAAASEEERTYYERLFPAGTQYKLTLYPLFMELAMRLTREGGYHGFLVPDSVLTGHHFSKIRDRLLQESDLSELALVESSPWPGAHVGYTVFYAARKKGNHGPPIESVRNRVLHSAKSASRSRGKTKNKVYTSILRELGEIELPSAGSLDGTDVWVPAAQYEEGGRPFRIFRDKEEMDFLSRIQKSPLCFKDVVWTYSGLIARYGQKSVQSQHAEARFLLRDRSSREVYNDPSAAKKWRPALLSGSEVTPHRVDWAGGRVYIPEDGEFLGEIFKSGFDLERYRRPKVFLRQTGDRLIAALDRGGHFCMNNLHLLGGRETVGVPPLLLVGLLMSRPIQRTYKIFALEGARPLAQVDLKTVESLPFPADASGFPIGGGPSPPRTHPKARAVLRKLEKALIDGDHGKIVHTVEKASKLGPEPIDEGPLTGRNVLTLVFLRLIELREEELNGGDDSVNASPRDRVSNGRKGSAEGSDGSKLQGLIDTLFESCF